MNSKVYDSRTLAIEAVCRMLAASSGIPEFELKEFALRANLVEELPPDAKSALPRHVQPVLVGRFAIRNDQLANVENFLSLLKSALKLGVGLISIQTLAGAASAADAIHSLHKLFQDVSAKGFRLTPEQLLVVSSLKSEASATTEVLVKRIGASLSAEKVEIILENLSRDQDPIRGFVLKEGDSWKISGL